MWPFKREVREATKLPELTPALVAEAKANPNGWVYVMDGIADPNGAVPPERIVGAWKVGPTGEITGEYKANHNYRPLKP